MPPLPRSDRDSTCLDLRGEVGECFNITISNANRNEEVALFESLRCPKKYFLPSEIGRKEDTLTPEEEQLIFDHSGEQVEDAFVFGLVETENPVAHTLAEKLRDKIYLDYRDTVFREEIAVDPQPRGPHGVANIKLKPGTVPKYQRPIPCHGEKLEFLKRNWKNGRP